MWIKLALWYLRKRKVSVIIGFELRENGVKQLQKTGYVYDNELSNNYKYIDSNNVEFDIPVGRKFKEITS